MSRYLSSSEADKPENLLIDDVKQFLKAYSRFRESRIYVGMYKSLLEKPGIHSDLLKSVYQLHESEYLKNAQVLLDKLPFQIRVGSTPEFVRSHAILTKRKINVFFSEGEDELINAGLYTVEDELNWRLQYVFACGIFAFNFPEEMDVSLAEYSLSTRKRFSNKTKQAAKRLRVSLKEDFNWIPKELSSYLDIIIKEESFGFRGYEHLEIAVNDNQRRRYAVYQICGVGVREFVPRRSTKARFFPEVVVDVLSVLGIDIDLRTANLIMEPFDRANIEAMRKDDKITLLSGVYTYSSIDFLADVVGDAS